MTGVKFKFLWIAAGVVAVLVVIFVYSYNIVSDNFYGVKSELTDGRVYSVVVPDKVDGTAGAPLLVALHGSGGDMKNFAEETKLGKLGFDEGFITVFGQADGKDSNWKAGNCCGDNPESVSDVKYLRDVIEDVESKYNVDRSRVFVVGFSAGGIMAYRAACELSDVVTGVGVVAGSLGVEGCSPENPVYLIHLHNSLDKTVPFNGGKGDSDDAMFKPVMEGVNVFVINNNCQTALEPVDTAGDSVKSWTDCDNNMDVKVMSWNGDKHEWFSNAPNIILGELKYFNRS